MPDRSPVSARRRALLIKRRRRQIAMTAVAAVGAVGLAALTLALLNRPGPRGATVAATVAATAEPTAAATGSAPAESPRPTPQPTPTPEPTQKPSPTPTAVPGSRPDVVSFYTPKGKSYSPRVRMGDSYTASWKKGKDIGSFEVIASDRDLLDGDFFGDIFGAAWKAFPDADACKIGYTLRYTLDDSSEIRYTMLSPSHIEHTEYIECWLYDDYHREPHKSYSHLKPSSMKSGTLMTSIKLTAGKQIAHVTDIWLTAFICASLDDFDSERNYIGNTSCTIHILKK